MIKNERLMPTVRRTREQIRKDIINYSNCMECNQPLLKRTKIRDTPKMCADCRGDKSNGNAQIRKIFIDMKKKQTEPAEDEMFFEDDPRGENDKEGKIIKKATVISYGASPLADIMAKTSYYNPVPGSAKDGVRYSYRKGKVN
jgi:ribosomal protein L37AE/L43A